MATLTLKNVPDDLHRRLKARAERNRRSVRQEVLRCLDAAVGHEVEAVGDEDPALRRADALRTRLADEGVRITAEEVGSAIEQGRPESGRASAGSST